jgi:transposase
MDIDLAVLPDDVEKLQQIVRSLAAERASLSAAQAEIERLRLIIKKLQRSQFGRRAEQLDDNQLQLGFEDLNADLARAETRLPPAKVRAPRSQTASICLARMSGSILSTKPAPAAVASCT